MGMLAPVGAMLNVANTFKAPQTVQSTTTPQLNLYYPQDFPNPYMAGTLGIDINGDLELFASNTVYVDSTAGFAVSYPGDLTGLKRIKISHDGTNTVFQNKTAGEIRFRNAADTLTTFSVTDSGFVLGSRFLTVVGTGETAPASGPVQGIASIALAEGTIGSGSSVCLAFQGTIGASCVQSVTLMGSVSAGVTGGLAFGASSAVTGNYGVAIGASAAAIGDGLAIGRSSAVTHVSSSVIGATGISFEDYSVTLNGRIATVGGTTVHLPGFTAAGGQRKCAWLVSEWANSTDASRLGRLREVVDNTGTPQTGTTTEASPTGVKQGFFGGAAVAKPAVTGSRGGNAALASLLTQLASLGLITDSTTA